MEHAPEDGLTATRNTECVRKSSETQEKVTCILRGYSLSDEPGKGNSYIKPWGVRERAPETRTLHAARLR